MPKTYKILNMNEERGCMLVKYSDGAKTHETEIPVPPHLSAVFSEEEVTDWVLNFWPHSQMEAVTMVERLRASGIIDSTIDITSRVPTPRDALLPEVSGK